MLFGYTIGCSEFDATNLVGCYHFIFQRLLVEQLLIKKYSYRCTFLCRFCKTAKSSNQIQGFDKKCEITTINLFFFLDNSMLTSKVFETI